MNKRLHLFFFTGTLVLVTHAQQPQWTPADSLKLQQLLHGDGEIKINKHAVKMIDFGSFVGKPEIVDDKPGLNWDGQLPDAKPEKQKLILTLKPYTATTPFNYDPIRKVKFKVRANTWRATTTYPDDVRVFKQKETIGARQNLMAVGSKEVYTHLSGCGVGGLDFNAVFTRKFWDKSIEKRRARTLEVLSLYGDSTTVHINQPIRIITNGY
ncbi:DUF4858 domain-containing protein [Bacteroides sp. 224]|uniref:DUF4858 domain-containing protein n=1 Tax=Bacteroides sp. 224 TaxID=2302936 RepID=UPI0013CF8270|nr:DUF4858 domain-containing protein [Bacteroides sp. 224]NDV66622.1 DUF4858 domain-containing protein [Bacteroides sp. 224]